MACDTGMAWVIVMKLHSCASVAAEEQSGDRLCYQTPVCSLHLVTSPDSSWLCVRPEISPEASGNFLSSLQDISCAPGPQPHSPAADE